MSEQEERLAEAAKPESYGAVGRWMRVFGCWVAAVLTAAAAVGLLMARFSPAWAERTLAWAALDLQRPEIYRGFEVLRVSGNPWQLIPASPDNMATVFRVFFPMLAYYTGMPNEWFIALPFVGVWAALCAVFLVLRKEGVPWLWAFCGVLVAGSAGWMFSATGWMLYFDGWVVLGLVCATHCRKVWWLFLAVFLTSWVDERVVLVWCARRTAGSGGGCFWRFS